MKLNINSADSKS